MGETDPAMYVQVIPIYFEADEAAAHYFLNHRDEVDAITGEMRVILHAGKLPARASSDVASAVSSDRFPGLKADDVPCLWVESGHAHFKVPLSTDRQEVARTLRRLAAAMKDAESFQDGEQRFFMKAATAASSKQSEPTKDGRPTIISLHGFNTRGDWQRDIQPVFNKSYVDHVPWTYGYVGVRKLLSGSDRDAKIEWFLRRYEAFRAQRPADAPLPSIIAHSYGSYIVAMAMMRYPQIRFNNIVLCGSIIPRDYDWDAAFKNGQFQHALNDYGKKDIWPRVAEWVMNDAGGSGYAGFESLANGRVSQRENQFWSHSSYFTLLNFEERWMPFVLTDVVPAEVARFRGRRFNRKFATVCALVSLMCVGVGWLLYRWLSV